MSLEHEKGSSGVAKAGLATGITGAALGVVNAMGGGGLFGGYGGHGNHGHGYNPDYVHHRDRDRDEKSQHKHEERLSKYVTKEVAELRAENAQLKAERYTDERISKLAHALEMLQSENQMLKRDIKEVYRYTDSTFVPQEKGYMDGRRVNFHGTHPLLGVDGGDERFPKTAHCCSCDLVAG